MAKNKAMQVLGTNLTHLPAKVLKAIVNGECSFNVSFPEDPASIFSFNHPSTGVKRALALNGIVKDRSTLVVFHRANESLERTITKRVNKDSLPRYRVGVDSRFVYFEKGQKHIPETILFVELSKTTDQVKHAMFVEVQTGCFIGNKTCHGEDAPAYFYNRITTIDAVKEATMLVKTLNAAGLSHTLWPNFTHQSAPWWS